MTSKEILSAIVAGLVLLAGGFWLARRKINRRTTSLGPAEERPSSGGQESMVDALPATALVAESEPEPVIESSPASERLATFAMKIAQPDLREFLKEIATRVEDTGPCFDDETPFNFIEEIVDRLDDLRAIRKNHQGQTANDLDSFYETLVTVLSDCGAELIHCERWDASLQRAIAKEPTREVDAHSIVRFGSTGIRRQGRLVRKQEVVLAVPETQ